jgi:hypothetical protein
VSRGPTIWVKFSGWFQCRLPTDPDPSDEPRGVSGYVRAVAGEPDLDRVIRLQPVGATPRSHCPTIGVTVVRVFGDPRHGPDEHPLVGAAVDLLDDAKFEGRNHILAEDGFEAVVPCHLRIKKDGFVVQRRFADPFSFPPVTADDFQKFAQLQATGVNISPGAMGRPPGLSIWHLYGRLARRNFKKTWPWPTPTSKGRRFHRVLSQCRTPAMLGSSRPGCCTRYHSAGRLR